MVPSYSRSSIRQSGENVHLWPGMGHWGSLQRLESREDHIPLAHRVNGKTWCVTSVASQQGDDLR